MLELLQMRVIRKKALHVRDDSGAGMTDLIQAMIGMIVVAHRLDRSISVAEIA
jgi:hypothetical protein